MKRFKFNLVNWASVLALTATVASCSNSDDLTNPTPPQWRYSKHIS